jgi:hypothetical protein
VSRQLAKRYVAQFLARGYTLQEASEEAHSGVWEAGGGGYHISHGKIECPPFSKQVFSFEELAKELERDRQQPSLFDFKPPDV